MSVTTVSSSVAVGLASDSELKSAVAVRLREAAEIIATVAGGIASGFSTRIPEAIRVASGAVAYITVNPTEAPNARPFEDGSMHPVFARGARDTWTWRKQPKRPFLSKAVTKAGPAAATAFSAVFDDWLKELDLID